MFCYQCEQTAHGTGCTDIGICGKTPEVAALQDMLVYSLKVTTTRCKTPLPQQLMAGSPG